MITSIVFDLGNVLINWEREHLYRKVFLDEKQMNWFLDNVCTWEWNEAHDGGKKIELGIAEKIAEFPEYESEIRMFYDRFEEMIGGIIQPTVDVLCNLRATANYKLYALTNWSAETFPKVRYDYAFFDLFDGIVVSGEENTRKPFHNFYQILTDRYKINPAEIVFIDDREINIESAKALGWNTILFSPDLDLKVALNKFNVEF